MINALKFTLWVTLIIISGSGVWAAIIMLIIGLVLIKGTLLIGSIIILFISIFGGSMAYQYSNIAEGLLKSDKDRKNDTNN